MSLPALKPLWNMWGSKRSGYVILSGCPSENINGSVRIVREAWRDYSFEWPTDKEKISTWVEENGHLNLYYCPTVFSEPRRHKIYAQPNHWLWADLDGTPLTSIADAGLPEPNVVIETSPEHYHAYWKLDQDIQPDDAEALNKGIAYKIGADKSGWDIGQVLRVPGTTNRKRPDPYEIKLRKWDKQPLDPQGFGDIAYTAGREPSSEEIRDILLDADDLDSGTLLRQWRTKLPRRALKLLRARDARHEDRSIRIHELERLLAEADVPAHEIFTLVKDSVWNKFRGRATEDAQLAKEILQAVEEVEARFEELTDPEDFAADPSLIFRPVDLYITDPVVDPGFLVEGWWPAGEQGVINAESGTYKSFLSLDMAISIASGEDFLGHFPVKEACSVLLIQEEIPKWTMIDRIKRIAKHKGLLNEKGEFIRKIPFYPNERKGFSLSDSSHRAAVEVCVAEVRPAVLILDPWYLLLGGADENTGRDIMPIIRFLNHLRDKYGCSILIVHHWSRSASNQRTNLNMRGWSGFGNWAGNTITLSVLDPQTKLIHVERRFRGREEPSPIGLRFKMENEPEKTYDVEVSEISAVGSKIVILQQKSEEQIALAMERLGSRIEQEGFSLTDLLGHTTLSRGDMERALSRMVYKNQLTAISEGTGANKLTRYKPVDSVASSVDDDGLELGDHADEDKSLLANLDT